MATKNTMTKEDLRAKKKSESDAVVYKVMIALIILCGAAMGLRALRGYYATTDGFIALYDLTPVIAIAGLFATVSYLFYYKAIAQIGASKAMALNVTYTAWAIVFGVVLSAIQGAFQLPGGLTIVCALVVLVCGVFAAADFKEIFNKK